LTNAPLGVMPGLDLGIHLSARLRQYAYRALRYLRHRQAYSAGVDCRVKPGNDAAGKEGTLLSKTHRH